MFGIRVTSCMTALMVAAMTFATPHGTQASVETSASDATPSPDELISQAEAMLWPKQGEPDPANAAALLEAAAAQSSIKAKRILGENLIGGWVMPQDVARGVALLTEASDAGDPRAQLALGQAYLWGTGVAPDPAKARPLLEAAAAKGNLDAQRILGEQLIGGWVLQSDPVFGRELLEQAIAAGDVKAHVTFGTLLMYGDGTTEDREAALELFEVAASEGDGSGLLKYGEDLMWRNTDPPTAEAILNRAGELGSSKAWVVLAHGAMYGYLGGGRKSRAKFNGYAELARAAREDMIEVLDATRRMWGISMRASGPETIAQLKQAADNGNVEAAKFMIEMLRDGNQMNLHRSLRQADAALEAYAPILGPETVAQFKLTFEAAKARTPQAYRIVADQFLARPDLVSDWLAQQIFKANPNVAVYIVQDSLKKQGLYSGSMNGLATWPTLRALIDACNGDDHPDRATCADGPIRPSIISALMNG